MQLWKIDYEQMRPRQVEAPHPAIDADGEPIYGNTHFETEEEAWDYFEEDAKARVSLSGREVERLRKMLSAAESAAADATIHMKRFLDAKRRAGREP